MNSETLAARIESHLNILCNEIGNRHVGSEGNRRATSYFEQVVSEFGFAIEAQPFDCIEWASGGVTLEVGSERWPATVNPYSLPCDAAAELVAASSIEALEGTEIRDRIVLLHGEIAAEQVMPKGFVFYNPEHHQRLIGLLETGRPAGLVCATGVSPGTAGSLYPFPLFEDGDFDIPSVTTKDVIGARLLEHVGEVVRLSFVSERIPATGVNLIARKGTTPQVRVVLCAHIDAKKETPGALDNGSGVATLIGLAELLADYAGETTIEIVPFNGEDYYSAPGQMTYLAALGDRMGEVELAINLDGVGHVGAGVACSFYGVSESTRCLIAGLLERDPAFSEGEPWPQGDHSLFVAAGRPALALTSTDFDWLCREITHTERDRTELVDCDVLATTAVTLRDLVIAIAS